MCLHCNYFFLFQFVIVGVYGETDKTDIAIDSVCITSCTGRWQTVSLMSF